MHVIEEISLSTPTPVQVVQVASGGGVPPPPPPPTPIAASSGPAKRAYGGAETKLELILELKKRSLDRIRKQSFIEYLGEEVSEEDVDQLKADILELEEKLAKIQKHIKN